MTGGRTVERIFEMAGRRIHGQQVKPTMDWLHPQGGQVDLEDRGPQDHVSHHAQLVQLEVEVAQPLEGQLVDLLRRTSNLKSSWD